MDSNEFNKIAGAVIGSLLVFVLLGFFASLVFHGGEGGHGGDETLAFALDTGEEEADAAEAEPEAPVDLAALVAAADAGAGEKLYSQCRACHRIEDGANAVGPHLWNVVGRDIAAVPGFGYSDALMAKDGAWDLENLLGFLEKPSDWAPGTIMGYAGLRKIEDRVNLIAYLNQAGDAPVDLAAMVPADTGASTGEAATDEAATDEAVTEDAATDVAATEEAATEEAATEEAVTEEAGTDEAATEEAVTEEAVTEEAATEETATETAGTDEAATEEAVTEEAVTEETATETAATEEAASEEAASEETATEEAATEEAATETAAVDSAFAPLLAAASAETGQKVFRKCQACHKVEDGKNGVGPHLWGVVGREIASVEGYSYSDALTGKDGVWDLETLDAFLAAPRSWAPGTKMAFAGLRDPQERVDVITYLNEASGSPVELAAAAPAAATAPEATEAAPEPEATEAETAEAEAETAEAAPEPEATEAETAEAAPEPEATEAETAEAAPEAEATEAETAEAAPEPEATGTETAEANAEPEATEAETAEAAPEAEATVTETAETAAEPETMEVAAVDPAATAETGETSEAGTYAALLASADADAGETLFRQCRACHKVEEGWSGVGPTLHGVVGRPIGSVEGYRYSTAFQALEGDWTLDRLMAYLENPRAWVPGTKMIYSGLRDAQDRIDLITFLNQADGSPVALE